MTEPDQPTPPGHGPRPGPPSGPPLGGGYPGSPPAGGTPPSGPPPPGTHGQPQYGQPQYGQPQYGQPQYGEPGFAQPAAQPYLGGYHGPDWIPELNMQGASAGSRIGAKALDIIFVVLIQATVSVVGVFALFASNSDTISGSGSFSLSTESNLALTMLLNLVLLSADAIYNVVVPARFGGQPGKLILGLRIVHRDGRQVGGRGAFMRWTPILALTLLAWVPVMVMSWLIVLLRFGLLVANLVLVLVDDRHRSVFDRVADTYVVVHR